MCAHTSFIYLKVEYGFLQGCCKKDDDSYCILQPLDRIESGGVPIVNELECPLLTLATCSRIVPSSRVVSAVSIAHECGVGCHFQSGTNVLIEREVVASPRLRYIHDYSNRFFSLNIYCMKCVY